jgi:hypothetical protein
MAESSRSAAKLTRGHYWQKWTLRKRSRDLKSASWKETLELTGMLAILIGLYFVFAEIRQNVVIARADLGSTTNQNLIEQRRMLADPEFSSIFLKGLRSPDQLTEVERFRLNNFYESTLIMYGFEYLNYSYGIFGEFTSVPRLNSPAIFGAGYSRYWWNARRLSVNPGIAEAIDNALAELAEPDAFQELDRQIREQIEADSRL